MSHTFWRDLTTFAGMAFRISVLMILLAAGLSLGFVARLKPVGLGSWLFFSVWLLLPYGMIAFSLSRKQRWQQAPSRQLFFAALVITAGILGLADIIVWRPDPQGALAVLMIPPVQIMFWFIINAIQSFRSSR